jgi:hypothetical protein
LLVNNNHKTTTKTLAMSGESWVKLYLSQVTPEDLIKSWDFKVTGSPIEAARLINLFDRYVLERAVVIPPALRDNR